MTQEQKLGDVCSLVMGQAPPGSSYNEISQGTPMIAGASDFHNGQPSAQKHTTSPTKMCRKGDIIIGIRATIGEKVIADTDYCLGRGVAGIRPQPSVHFRYLWHWLTDATPTLVGRARGATFKQINRADLSDLLIRLPPIGKQRRIAEILDHADVLRARRRAAIEELDQLARSIFLEMFGDPAQNSLDWATSAIGDVGEVQGGLQVSAKRKTLPQEVHYLRVANVFRGRLDLEEIKLIRARPREIERTRLIEGDLLIVEGHGNPNELGRCAVWDGSIEPCVHQNHLIRVRFDREKVHPTYGSFYLNSVGGRRHLLDSGRTTSGLNTISVSVVRSTPLAVPPISIQIAFADRIAALDRLKAAHRAHLAELDALFASLQHRAFRGEL